MLDKIFDISNIANSLLVVSVKCFNWHFNELKEIIVSIAYSLDFFFQELTFLNCSNKDGNSFIIIIARELVARVKRNIFYGHVYLVPRNT